ncbi:MAG: hypothetical protein ACRCSC_00915, partial [Lactococcus garvieae]
MSFPLEPITNSSAALTNNSTALSVQLPIIGVNSSQAALATMAPTAPNTSTAEPHSVLTTNLTTSLFKGYSSAPAWNDVAMNTSPNATQAGRRAQTARPDDETESSTPLVRRRVRREDASSTTNSNVQPTDPHIGKIMCGGNETHPITKPDFTFANVFPAHTYTGDEAVERCAQLAFDPAYKDCAEGVRKVCDALLKHLNARDSFDENDNKLSPAAWALMDFLQNVTENSFNRHVLLNAADKKRYKEKKEEDKYFYYPINSKNSFKGTLTGTDIKLKKNGTEFKFEGVGINDANLTFSKIDAVTLNNPQKYQFKSLNREGMKEFSEVTLNNISYHNNNYQKNGQQLFITSAGGYYQLNFNTTNLVDLDVEFAEELNVNDATTKANIEVKLNNVTVTGATEHCDNATIVSGILSGEIKG